MANAPKKRPPSLRSDRRPPRGPLPVPAKDTNLRPRLTAASSKLREMNEPDLADAIDTVLAPNGWGRLRRSDPATTESLDRNMAMYMPIEWREQIKERAKKAGNEIKDDVNEGFRLYRAGKFEPIAGKLSPRGSADAMGNLNTRPENDLRVAIDEMDGPSPALVGAAYLMSKYRVGPYAPKKAAKK
ncbi:hypothetical protein [Streptomyces sp. NPDC056192]|uniref:hypothetical protein n=1 Tax=Streptomyces sp. NPDC056192 TaxID=3345743 RepID=UPI0035DDC0BE